MLRAERPTAATASAFIGGLVVLGLLVGATASRVVPSMPAPLDAPASRFSASRAAEVLRDLSGDSSPRPIGSLANARCVSRIEARFRALGYQPRVQERFGCGIYGMCGTVRNVVVLPPGREKVVLLVAHHDSVAAGPGISDDLANVAAILEMARALRAGPPTPRPIGFLISDAEELGLVGASTFVGSHPEVSRIAAIVNLDVRGTAGPSLVYQASGAASVHLGAIRSIPRPIASSLFSAVFRLLQNDSDFAAFARLDLPGLDFAYIAGVNRYHTPRDNLEEVSLASVQHQGEGALAAARFFASTPDKREATRSASYFDLLGHSIASWPGRATLPLAIVAALCLVMAVARLSRRAGLNGRSLSWGLLLAFLAPALAAVASLALLRPILLHALPRYFVADPSPFIVAVWCIGLASVAIAAELASPRHAAALRVGTLALPCAIALGISGVVPDASPAILPLALVGSLAALAEQLVSHEGSGFTCGAAAACLATTFVAGFSLLPIAWLLPDALGVASAPVVAALVALVFAPVAPALTLLPPAWNRSWIALCLVAASVAAVVASRLPHASEAAPIRMSIAFIEEQGKARWFVEAETGRLPESFARLSRFSTRLAPPAPWAPRGVGYGLGFDTPASTANLPVPSVELLGVSSKGEIRKVRLRLSSNRGAPRALMLIPPEVRVVSASMDGVPLPGPSAKARRLFGGYTVCGSATLPPSGTVIDLELRATEPVEVVIVDETAGLPAGGRAFQDARPRFAVPSQDGDVTIVSTKVKI